MPLLLAYRRWWCLLFTAILFLPFLGHVLPDLPGPVRPAVAPAERWWERAGERLDPFINAHFGFRGAIMGANAAYARAFHSTRARPLVIGDDGQLFYTGDKALEQSLGLVVRESGLETFGAVLQSFDAALKARGAKLVVTSPPNNATALSDKLPDWAEAQMRKPTELDMVATDLTRRGVTFVDLRPLLKDAGATGPIYMRTDSHWNQRGALLAFNAAMAAAGRPDLAIPADAALGPLTTAPTGDLARYLGEASPTGDRDYEIRRPEPHAKLTPLKGVVPEKPPSDPFQPYAFSTGHDGPSILVIGDSFTQHYWKRFLEARASRFGWMHNNSCKFEWNVIDTFKPDIVLYAPTERSLPCKGLPIGMP
ncbi:alginate O-acetyltransferase AlgX-related protein [Aquabacter cavernae]|uniref:alginate O-acetyltransferase AlgX-related protein n=1 Tax=Aquabacter cavernae TaxID=2496029 RepID=UPI000F8C7E91|nr:hypothetical protein [Aquabacter cavernae]